MPWQSAETATILPAARIRQASSRSSRCCWRPGCRSIWKWRYPGGSTLSTAVWTVVSGPHCAAHKRHVVST